MSDSDHGSEAAKNALDALARGDLKKALEEALGGLSGSGIPIALLQQVAAASFALGRADAENQPAPPEALDLLKVMTSEQMAPDAFRALRKSLGISLSDIGKACGVTHVAVSSWERGTLPMPEKAIHALMMLKSKQLPEDLGEIISGADLRAIRKMLGMRQTDLAAALGVSVPALVQWEGLPSKPLAPKTAQRIRPQFEALRARVAEIAP